jgi:hypothetical protein
MREILRELRITIPRLLQIPTKINRPLHESRNAHEEFHSTILTLADLAPQHTARDLVLKTISLKFKVIHVEITFFPLANHLFPG